MPSIQKDNTSWKKRILIPFWVVRILFLLLLIGLYAIALAALGVYSHRNSDDDVVQSSAWKLGIGLAVFFMVLLILCVVLDIISIILFMRHSLKPKVMLVFNVIQSAIWLFVIILQIMSVAQGASPAGLIVCLVIGYVYFLSLFPPPLSLGSPLTKSCSTSFVVLLVYSSINCHRARKNAKRGNYAPANNPANPPSYGQQTQGFTQPQDQQFHNGAYNPYAANTTYNGAGYGAPVELQNQQKPTGHATEYYVQQSHV